MNYINCGSEAFGAVIRKSAIFWSENTAQHINSLLKATVGTTAVLDEYFKNELNIYGERFVNFNQSFKNGELPMHYYQDFLRCNSGFINLLERLKFEAFSGYPVLSQTLLHYIYEARYINAIFGNKNITGNVLITNSFLPFLNNALGCFYNQIYFWSIIGAMHPSLLMENNAFYNALNGYAKEFLTEVCNNFNKINFSLSSLKKPIKKNSLIHVFNAFSLINTEYLEFLDAVKQSNPKIFITPNLTRLPISFYKALEHQINEHKLVKEINENISSIVKGLIK